MSNEKKIYVTITLLPKEKAALQKAAKKAKKSLSAYIGELSKKN